MMRLSVLSMVCFFAATASAREGDVPFQAGYCVGSGVGGVVSSCSEQMTESACSGYEVLWMKTCEWKPQPFATAEYQSLPSTTKMQRLWQEITKDETSDNFPGTLTVVASALKMNMKSTFNFASDQMPEGHERKIIHTVGAHAKLAWKNTGNHPYTGIFKSGSKNSIIRFSLAAAPDTKAKFAPPGSQPGTWKVGFALKALRDGIPSANFVAMRPAGAGGQNSANFFENELVNHVGAPDNAVLKDKFATASEWVNMVGLKDFAEFDASGTKEASPVFPYMLTFKPRDSVKNLFPNQYDGKRFTRQMETIKSATTVYDVHAQASPKSSPRKIAELQLASSPVASAFGDKKLFFQHRKMEYDFDQNKHWLKDESSKPVKSRFFGVLNLNAKMEPAVQLDATGSCPFAAGTAYTALAAAQQSHADKDRYIAHLHARVEQLSGNLAAAKEATHNTAGGHPLLVGVVLVALLAGAVGAVVMRKFVVSTGEAPTISV